MLRLHLPIHMILERFYIPRFYWLNAMGERDYASIISRDSAGVIIKSIEILFHNMAHCVIIFTFIWSLDVEIVTLEFRNEKYASSDNQIRVLL